MEVQQEVAFKMAAGQAGQLLDVLIDQPAGKGKYAGRHAGQAPEVDALTYVRGKGLQSGDMVRVLVERSEGYDLIARPTDAILPILKTQ
jgi:ribosomal protein S12 methylthiotransferase